MTCREYKGDMRGLAEFSQAAAEVAEGYLSGLGFPLKSMGSKPQAGFPNL